MKEYIIRMLEYANERELRLIYVFAGALIDFDRTPGPKACVSDTELPTPPTPEIK